MEMDETWKLDETTDEPCFWDLNAGPLVIEVKDCGKLGAYWTINVAGTRLASGGRKIRECTVATAKQQAEAKAREIAESILSALPAAAKIAGE